MEQTNERELLWFMQTGQRPWRELHWLSLMPHTRVTSVGSPTPPEAVERHLASRYRQPTKRFIEAGAMAWLRDLQHAPTEVDWVSSLEPFSLTTGQAARFARRHQLNLAVLMWHNFQETPLYKLPGYRNAWLASKDADFFLCLIDASRRHILEMGVDPERVDCVLPGIDTAVFHPPEAPVEEPVVAFISPLRNNKGLDRVLLAFEQVKVKVPEARLVIAGTGEDEAMAATAAERDPGHVEYLGGLDQAGVADLMRRSAVFVTAPRATRMWNEQFGLVYLEAMASGMVVVTTASGTNDEAVKEPNKRVPDEVDAIAEAIIGFLADPVQRAEAARANREWVVANHDVHTQARRMGEAFSRAERRLGLV
ncbi:MAG TPA: glycosyltransferase family 4 protein [Nocardioides sp.]|jgi:glycosyltransferase involved in cell wall biosynthesis